MSHPAPSDGASSGLVVTLKTLGVMAWFSAMFFVLGPYLVLHATGSSFEAGFVRSPFGAKLLAGAILMLLGVQIAHFVRRGQGTPAPFDPPREFVASGIYRRSRNPMYLLYVGLMASEAWLFSSLPLLAYAIGFFGLAHLYVTRVEEPGLRARFGEGYRDYCRDVPRWWSFSERRP